MWLAEQLSRLDQFFLGFGGSRLAFVAALAVFLVSTAALDRVTPLKAIARCVGADNYVSTGMSFGYRVADLYTMLDAYKDPASRRGAGCGEADFYKAHRCFIALDMIYPVLYSLSLAVMLGCLLPYVVPPAGGYRPHYLTLVPLLAGLCDVIENLSLLFVINRHQAGQKSYWLAAFSSLMTSAKIVLFAATLFVILVGLLMAALAFFRGTKSPAATSP